jgi:SAM-dependent methyltransferase
VNEEKPRIGERLNPRQIKTVSELQRIAGLLKEYYKERPDSYGLMDREQFQYDGYADAVGRWTPEKGTLLDLGCGTFRTPLLLQQRGFNATGCDIFSAEKLRDYRRRLGPAGPRLLSYDQNTLPFDDGTFDTVASLCVTDMNRFLSEMLRVVKRGGRIVVVGPNLSGPHRIILGIFRLAGRRGRFWQYRSVIECLRGGYQIMEWTVRILFSSIPKFIYVYPLMKNGNLHFESPDDDAVHVNHPLSFKKWFRKHGCRLDQYNAGSGDSAFTRVFNRFFPSFATKVQIVARKEE